MFVSILLINLLIAIMNGTFEGWQSTATGMWALQFTELLHRCEGMSFPPPFNMICFLIYAFIQNDIWTKCGIHMYSYRIVNNIPSVNESRFLPNKKRLQTITVTTDTVTIGGFTGTSLRLYDEDDEVTEKSIKDVTITNNRATKISIYRGSDKDYLMPHLITLFPNTHFTIKNVRVPVKWTIFEYPGDPDIGEPCTELHIQNHYFTLMPSSELTKCSTCGTYTQVLKCNECTDNDMVFQMCLRCYYSVKFGTEQYHAEHFKMCYVPAEQWWGSRDSGMGDTSQNKVVQIIIARYSEQKRKEAGIETTDIQTETADQSTGNLSLRSTFVGSSKEKEKVIQKADIESSGSQEDD